MQIVKQYWVWMMLALTVLASIWVQQQEDATEEVLVVTTSTRKPEADSHVMPQRTLTVASQNISYAVATREEITDTPINIFTPYSAENDVASDEAEPLPQAPANPYTYAGKLMEDGSFIVFLTDGVQNHAVRTGDVINTNWRIQSINSPELTLEYMPLGVTTKMQIGAAH